MSNELDIFVDVESAVGQLDINNKALIVALLMSARRNVAIQLAKATPDGFKEAVNTMQKVEMVGDYIKKRRGDNKAELVTQNLVVAERLRIVRDIGKWLKVYLYDRENNLKQNVRKQSEPSSEEEIIQYHLEQLGISKAQSYDWQTAAKLDGEEFEKWLAKFLETAWTREDELSLAKLLQYIKPKTESTKEEPQTIFQELKTYFREYLQDASDQKVSKGEFIKVVYQWKDARDYVERTLKQIGELY